MRRRGVLWVMGSGAVLAIAAQFLPYGLDHTDPPVGREPTWPDRATRELAAGACFDCHSNETDWPWYSNVAPVRWFLTRDVSRGRKALNFSEWQHDDQALGAAESVENGAMPPVRYRLMHSTARLSDQERTDLARGLRSIAGS